MKYFFEYLKYRRWIRNVEDELRYWRNERRDFLLFLNTKHKSDYHKYYDKFQEIECKIKELLDLLYINPFK